jgi:hypothetical protein
LQLQWAKCARAEWCLLEEVDPASVIGVGVWVLWRPGDAAHAPIVLFVGSGNLHQGIADCRRDPVLGAAAGLRVTWATVDHADVAGVAVYLYQQLRPLWGEVPQPVPARPVNLPLQA